MPQVNPPKGGFYIKKPDGTVEPDPAYPDPTSPNPAPIPVVRETYYLSSADLPFSTSVPLNRPGMSYMDTTTVSGPLVLKPAANAVRGAMVYLRLISNGTNVPDLTAFKQKVGSQAYNNGLGIENQLQFEFDGFNYFVTVGQAVNAVPVTTTTKAGISSAPVINGTPAVGTPLSITAGVFTPGNPAATITRSIYAASTLVASGTVTTTYTPVSADLNKTFTVVEIASNSAGDTPNMSADSAKCVAAPAATVQSIWTGVPKADGAVVSAKLNSANTASSARVAVSVNPNLTSPVHSPVVTPDATYRVVKHSLTGLQPNTEYFYGIEVDGTLDTATKGRFRTLPAAGAADFSIVLGGCATNTDDAAFAAINALNPKPLFLLAMGDFQYMDIASPTTANYHTAFDTSLARTVRKVTHSQIPTVFTWDDHDFQTNDATGRDASNAVRSFRATGLQFFRDRIPAITASNVATDTAHYSMVVGRVRFIVSDMRSDKTQQSATDNSSKTMMGTAQKSWFKAEIAAAKAAGQVVAWVNSVPWVVAPTAGADDWGGYTTERTELSDYIKAQAMTGKVFILSADMHALAIHAGADYATGGGGAIPVFHAGPFNRTCSTKGGPYTYGPYPASGSAVVQQYGVMDVADNGATLSITWKGYSADGTLRMSHTFNPIEAPVAPVATKFEATGGTVTEPGDGYKYWTFPSNGNLNVTTAGEVEYLAVGGGGGGSRGNTSVGGGGGAGGVRDSDTEGLLTIPVGTHPITIGQGGAGGLSTSVPVNLGGKGGNTSIGSLITAEGGGYGNSVGNGAENKPGGPGGSGGGGGNDVLNVKGGTGIPGQGYDGGNGVASNSIQADRSAGGGGGAGGPGGNSTTTKGGDGGPGVTVFGRNVAGGGGGAAQSGTQGMGTHGGGTSSKTSDAGVGTANTGGGGGGSCLNFAGGSGGSGIVVIRRAV